MPARDRSPAGWPQTPAKLRSRLLPGPEPFHLTTQPCISIRRLRPGLRRSQKRKSPPMFPLRLSLRPPVKTASEATTAIASRFLATGNADLWPHTAPAKCGATRHVPTHAWVTASCTGKADESPGDPAWDLPARLYGKIVRSLPRPTRLARVSFIAGEIHPPCPIHPGRP